MKNFLKTFLTQKSNFRINRLPYNLGSLFYYNKIFRKDVIKCLTDLFLIISCNEYGVTCVSFSSPGMETISAQESELETEKSIRGIYFILHPMNIQNH